MRPLRAFASAEIDATIDLVWSVMLDFSAYPQWNPFIRRIEGIAGAPEVGQAMVLEVHFIGGSKVRSPERIGRIAPPAPETADPRPSESRQATLVYCFEGFLSRLHLVRGSRFQYLEQRPGGPTVYRTEEEFHGLLRRFVPLAAVQDGFERHAQALKARAESLAGR